MLAQPGLPTQSFGGGVAHGSHQHRERHHAGADDPNGKQQRADLTQRRQRLRRLAKSQTIDLFAGQAADHGIQNRRCGDQHAVGDQGSDGCACLVLAARRSFVTTRRGFTARTGLPHHHIGREQRAEQRHYCGGVSLAAHYLRPKCVPQHRACRRRGQHRCDHVGK